MIPVRWGITGGPDAETGESMGGTKIIESKNLILRGTTFEDCDYFAKWEQDETVTENFIYYRDHSYKEIVTDFVMNNSSESVLQFTIVSKETDRPVGRMVLTNIDRRTDSLDCHMIYIADRRSMFVRTILPTGRSVSLLTIVNCSTLSLLLFITKSVTISL